MQVVLYMAHATYNIHTRLVKLIRQVQAMHVVSADVMMMLPTAHAHATQSFIITSISTACALAAFAPMAP
jgi:hypothetical protein